MMNMQKRNKILKNPNFNVTDCELYIAYDSGGRKNEIGRQSGIGRTGRKREE